MAYFQLQPAEIELQQLADSYWHESGERERELETAAYEAGQAIRSGEFTLTNLEAIVRWKSERMVHYLIGNSNESIRTALAVAALPNASAEDALNALIGLRGVDISIASAVCRQFTPSATQCLTTAPLKHWAMPVTTSGSIRNTTMPSSTWLNAAS